MVTTKSATSKDGTESEDSHVLEKNVPLQLPKRDASPAEVRTFIYETLVMRNGLDEEHARDITTRWTVGGGYELCTYTAAMYRELFGPEPAWLLYRVVRTLAWNSPETKWARLKLQLRIHFAFSCVAAFMFYQTLLLSRRGVDAGAWVLSFIFTILAVSVWLIYMVSWIEDNDEIIRTELKAAIGASSLAGEGNSGGEKSNEAKGTATASQKI